MSVFGFHPCSSALRAAHVLALLAFACSAVALASTNAPGVDLTLPDKSAIVARINGEPVTVAEFRFHLQPRRAEVFRYFARAHRADDRPDFWRVSYGGEVPLERLHAETLDTLVELKLVQRLAREHGLAHEGSHGAFVQRWAHENARRRDALAAGRVVYGPRQYGAQEFFAVERSNLLAALRKRVSADAFAALLAERRRTVRVETVPNVLAAIGP